MKQKLKWMLPFIGCLLLMVAYFTMTAIGALRFAIIASGHPIAAVTVTIMDEPHDSYTEENKVGYSLRNPPFEEISQSELVNWVVTKHGVFYTASYYGWG